MMGQSSVILEDFSLSASLRHVSGSVGRVKSARDAELFSLWRRFIEESRPRTLGCRIYFADFKISKRDNVNSHLRQQLLTSTLLILFIEFLIDTVVLLLCYCWLVGAFICFFLTQGIHLLIIGLLVVGILLPKDPLSSRL